MTKAEFEDLLHRYKTGKCSEAEIKTIDNWFAKISHDKLELAEWKKAEVYDRMFNAINGALPSSIDKRKGGSRPFLILKIAATLLLMAVVGYLLLPLTTSTLEKKYKSVASASDWVEHGNITQAVETIKLPDSSTVRLKPGAQISYPKKWNRQTREVHLNGEAFFDVVKDSSRPFFVYGGAVVTKVLGTSFSVKASPNSETIEVSVHTGKVSVYENPRENTSPQPGGDTKGVILTPNEKVEYFVNDKHWVTSLVEQPRSVPASNKSVDLVFSSTPMKEIVESIERTYSIGVIIENETSYDCTFTGDVSMMELYDMLDVICKSTGTNYEVKGTKILITGRGCE